MTKDLRVLVIVLIVLPSIGLAYFLISRDRDNDRPVKHDRRAEALRDMNFSFLLPVREYLFGREVKVQRDQEFDEALKIFYEASANAEGWKYLFQVVEEFAETGNDRAPFVTTVITFLQHPEDPDVTRAHTKTWLYLEFEGWKPVIEDVFHSENKEGGRKYWFNEANVWDGDYD